MSEVRHASRKRLTDVEAVAEQELCRTALEGKDALEVQSLFDQGAEREVVGLHDVDVQVSIQTSTCQSDLQDLVSLCSLLDFLVSLLDRLFAPSSRRRLAGNTGQLQVYRDKLCLADGLEDVEQAAVEGALVDVHGLEGACPEQLDAVLCRGAKREGMQKVK